jgi:hypothetical protein
VRPKRAVIIGLGAICGYLWVVAGIVVWTIYSLHEDSDTLFPFTRERS